MDDIANVSDTYLRKEGPAGIIDDRAAEEAGISVEELVRIMDIWQKQAFLVSKERSKRNKVRLANIKRTVVE